MNQSSLGAVPARHPAYEALRARLDEFPLGAPPHESLDQILAELFTPDEAVVAAALPTLPTPVSEIAARLGRDAAEVEAACEAMANKGLVFAAVRGETRFYSLLPLVPGIFEMQFMKAETTPLTMRLARLFNTYYYAGWGKTLSEATTPWPRVVSVERQIPAGVEVLPYERVSELLKQSGPIALAQCYCRHEANLLGEGCGAPLDVCMVFGRFAEFCVDRGFARQVTLEEAMVALDRAEEAGLVHITDNCQERLNFLCNCCGCCCGILRGITELGRPTSVATSSYIVAYDAAECSACGACVDRCHVTAISETDDGVAIDFERCIGCGLCNLVCPTDALKMARRPDAPVPAKRWRDLQITLMGEKASRGAGGAGGGSGSGSSGR